MNIYYDHRFPGRSLSMEEVIAQELQEAPDYHDGAIESLQRKQEKLGQLIAALAQQLPPPNQQAFLEWVAPHYRVEL